MLELFKIKNGKILRFLVSGVIASFVNFLIFNSVYLIFRKIFLASICGYCIGLLVSFSFAKFWVFKNRSKQKLFKSFFIFCLIYFLGGLEMSFVILFLSQSIDNHRIVWFFGAFVGSLNNYLGSNYFSFKK